MKKVYSQIHLNDVIRKCLAIAEGLATVFDRGYILADIVKDVHRIVQECHDGGKFYIAIRESGTESGTMEYCIERCKVLGYPLVIIKIEENKTWDYDMTVSLTHNWMSGDDEYMEQEFKSL